MRQISSFVSATLVVAILVGCAAVAVTRANTGTGKADDFPARYSIGGPSLPIVY